MPDVGSSTADAGTAGERRPHHYSGTTINSALPSGGRSNSYHQHRRYVAGFASGDFGEVAGGILAWVAIFVVVGLLGWPDEAALGAICFIVTLCLYKVLRDYNWPGSRRVPAMIVLC